MMATLAFLSALSVVPAQEGQLRLINERATYGVLGATRPNDKVLPGDAYFLTFDIENLKMDDSGRVRYKMNMEVVNKDGKSQFKADPTETVLWSSLGGPRLPAYAHALLGTDMAPGEYTINVKVEDIETKKTAELSKKFQVAATEFGLVRVNTSYDARGDMQAPAFAVAGQSIYLNFAPVAFKRDDKTKQPNIAVEMRVLDESGKPTLEKPIPGAVKDNVPEALSLIPMNLMLTLNRAGKFTIEVKATDKIANKTTTLKLPITVLDATK